MWERIYPVSGMLEPTYLLRNGLDSQRGALTPTMRSITIDIRRVSRCERPKSTYLKNGRSQAVRFRQSSDLPRMRFHRAEPSNRAVILSEQPPRPSLREIYKELDDAGAADFELDRAYPACGGGLAASGPRRFLLDTNITGYIVRGRSIQAQASWMRRSNRLGFTFQVHRGGDSLWV